MNSNKLLILKGSPRENGNSSILANQVAKGAQDAGTNVESYQLHNMNIKPCDACDFCQGVGDGNCIVEDDMQILYPNLITANGIVLASPIYWFTMSAQMKLCIDRWYALEGPEGNALSGKRFGIVLTYGDTDPYSSGAINAIRTFQDMFRYLNAKLVGIVYGSAEEAGEIQKQQIILEQAYNLGQTLAIGN